MTCFNIGNVVDLFCYVVVYVLAANSWDLIQSSRQGTSWDYVVSCE